MNTEYRTTESGDAYIIKEKPMRTELGGKTNHRNVPEILETVIVTILCWKAGRYGRLNKSFEQQ